MTNTTFRNANEAYEYLHNKILLEGVPFDDTKALFNVGFTIKEPKVKFNFTSWYCKAIKGNAKPGLRQKKNCKGTIMDCCDVAPADAKALLKPSGKYSPNGEYIFPSSPSSTLPSQKKFIYESSPLPKRVITFLFFI